MTEASRALLALAEHNARAYASNPLCRAIIVTGSAAEGISDFYSDLDLIVYYESLPTEEVLLSALKQNHGQERHLFGEPSAEAIGEAYTVAGVECQVEHTTVANWKHEMDQVLVDLDVDSPLQKALGGLLDGIPLYGEPLVRQWQERAAAYPDALAQAMVQRYMRFFPLWAIPERLATRDATIWIQQVLVEIAQNLLGTLAGLNRHYYSTFQFKRTARFCEQLSLAPANLAPRLEALLRTETRVAATQAQALVGETLDLVEQHLPEIDTKQARAQLALRLPPWHPPLLS